jgi:hypothetical protein
MTAAVYKVRSKEISVRQENEDSQFIKFLSVAG